MTQQFMTLGDTAGIFNSCASHDARLLGDIGRPTEPGQRDDTFYLNIRSNEILILKQF